MSRTQEYLEHLWSIGRRSFTDLTAAEKVFIKKISKKISHHEIDDIFEKLLEQAVWDDGAFRMPWQEPDEYLAVRKRNFGY